MLEWLNMGGYAAFVWPAYAIAALGLGGILILALRAHSRALRELEAKGGDGKA
ncbi:MAG: heme exporter protein CcmD [Alphaproteobacteria bacterium]